jgi:hypothetical protein
VAKNNGLDGRDGQEQYTPHGATSKVSTSSMASIYSELAANAALVLIGVACSLLEPQGPQGNPGSDGAQGPQGEEGAPGEVSTADLTSAIGGTSANTNAVSQLAYIPNDPPTAADWQALADKVNELITALRR